MLIALLQNNQQQPGQSVPASLPVVHVDRGGGGPLGPRVDIVDILGAIQTFREIPGEHPVARAVRRTKHVQDHIGGLRDARERREGAAFLAGATLAQGVADEQREADRAQHAEEVQRLLATIDGLRAELSAAPRPAAPAASRGSYGGGSGAMWFVVGAGAGIALSFLIGRARSRPRARVRL